MDIRNLRQFFHNFTLQGLTESGEGVGLSFYIGQPYDDATQLSYLQMRYLNGQTGKFLSQDPISNQIANRTGGPNYILDVNGGIQPYSQLSLLSNPQMLNSYSYSVDNPITKSDPTGQGGIVFVPLGVAVFVTANAFVYGAADLFPGDQSAMRNFAKGNLDYVNGIMSGKSDSLPLLAMFAGGGKPGEAFSASERASIGLPSNKSQLGHIFEDRTGHLPDTPQNRQLLLDTANNPKALLGPDANGNNWSATTQKNGTQVWVKTRDGTIINGGLNQTPQTYNPQTGLSSPVKPGTK